MKITQPHNHEAEIAVLGSCILDQRLITEAISAGITVANFWSIRHRLIWEAICAVQTSGCDEVAIVQHLRTHTVRGTLTAEAVPPAKLDEMQIDLVTPSLIVEITETVETTSNFNGWVQILINCELARRYLSHLQQQIEAVSQAPHNVTDLIEAGSSWHIEINQSASMRRSTFQSNREANREVVEKIERVRAGWDPPGLQSGIHNLDRLLSLKPGCLAVIAARPGMGKSALALNIAYHNARNHHVPVLVFTLEMPNTEVAERIIAIHGQINTRLYEANRSHVGPARFRQTADEAAELPIFMEECAPLNTSKMRAIARRSVLQHNIGLVIVDYIQLADADAKSKAPREQAISEISRSCKLMAKELSVPVIALSQLNREVEKREPPKPRLSDLRESGSIEQDADIVLFISPTERDDDGRFTTRGRMDLDIAKHRGGVLATVPVQFSTQFLTFGDYQGND